MNCSNHIYNYNSGLQTKSSKLQTLRYTWDKPLNTDFAQTLVINLPDHTAMLSRKTLYVTRQIVHIHAPK